MGLQTRVDTAVESVATFMPLPIADSMRRQRSKRIDPEALLVAGQWVEIRTAGSTVALRGFVFSIRAGEVLFTFPDLAACPEGLAAGHGVEVRYASRTGRYKGQADILRVAKGPPVTVAVQHLTGLETEQRRRYPRISLKIPATLVAGELSDPVDNSQSDARARVRNLGAGGMLLETSLSLAAGDKVNVLLPQSAKAMANHNGSRQVAGKVLRVEKGSTSGRGPRVASVELSFNSDDERDGWARLVLAQQRRR
jgi:hypothetical protein